MPEPRLPLPPPLRGKDSSNLFPHQTLSTRLPRIVRLVLSSRDWHPTAQHQLAALLDEMPHALMPPLNDPQAPDAAAWEIDFVSHVGQTWLDAPWFAAEMYFFRRILQATGYYQAGAGYHVDPYQAQKQQEMASILPVIRQLCAVIGPACTPAAQDPEKQVGLLAKLLRLATWGNQADRSMWPAGSIEQPEQPGGECLDEALLADQALEASQHLVALVKSARRVDFILDNVGIELAYDLGLVDFLLRMGLVQQVRLHVKPHPTYVSDATYADVLAMIDYLAIQAETDLGSLGQRLKLAFNEERLALQTDYFWTSPLPGWQMPPAMHQEFGETDLLVSKGDANYRRWVGDRHWAHDAPLAEILNYLPAPWLALRVLKANTIAGLAPGVADAAAQKDPHWISSGKWGVIQFLR